MSRFSGMEGNLEMILAFFFLRMTRNMLLGRTDLFTWLVMIVWKIKMLFLVLISWQILPKCFRTPLSKQFLSKAVLVRVIVLSAIDCVKLGFSSYGRQFKYCYLHIFQVILYIHIVIPNILGYLLSYPQSHSKF